MTANGEIAWGATVDDAGQGEEMREWTVELGSSLGSLAVDAALARFADDASRVGAIEACSVTLGRFGMRLTLTAAHPEEAADEAAQLFERVLATAVWPRSLPTPFVPCEVAVVPADGRPASP